MTKNEKYNNVKINLKVLAQGINPITGELLSHDSELSSSDFKELFETAAEIIEKYQSIKPAKKHINQFHITDEQINQIVLSENSVGISVVARRIKAVLSETVKPLPASKIADWLEMEGLLTSVYNKETSHKTRIATQSGNEIGITTNTEIYDGVEIQKNYYNINAQAYIVANLENIAKV